MKRETMIPISSRRTFIKGLPAGLAGLSVLSPFWDRLISRAAAATASGQQRLLVWHVPDGLPPEWFFPSAAGALTIRTDRSSDFTGTSFSTAIPAADQPTFLLQPIASYAANTTIIIGISNPGSGDHVLSTQSVLTGDAVTASDKGTSVSLDVLMSEVNKTNNHPIPVLRTGLYGAAISYTGTRDLCRPRNNGNKWIEPSWQPVTDARIMLDAVGATAPTTATGTSAATLKKTSRLAGLGVVKARVDAMKCAMGTPAAQRLEAYIAQVATLEATENQMARVVTPFKVAISGTDAAVTAAQSKSDWTGYQVTAAYLLELVITAFALDYCPAVTLQWAASGRNHISGNSLTDPRYSFIPNLEVQGAGEHALAHPQNSAFIDAGYNISGAQSTRDRIRIRRWFFEQMKVLLDRLSSIPDGTGTLFDHTTLLHTSEFGGPYSNSAGGQHSNRNLPYMTVSGSQTPFKGGQSLKVNDNHGNYLLTLAKGFGSPATTMGIGTKTIDGILK
jgi:hypothetical protein